MDRLKLLNELQQLSINANKIRMIIEMYPNHQTIFGYDVAYMNKQLKGFLNTLQTRGDS